MILRLSVQHLGLWFFVLVSSFGLRISDFSQAAEAPRPNVVFLLIDDLGRADCGFMGGREIRTPNIDRLAAAGAILDQFYVQPVCSPTRAALLTGRYPMRLGLQVGVIRPYAQYGLALEERTLAQALRQAGYATAICGKWHLGTVTADYLPTRRGFDRQYGHYLGAIDCFTHTRDGGFDWHRDDQTCRDEGYSTFLLADEAVRIIDDTRPEKPLFLYVPFNAVHSPLQSPPEYESQYADLPKSRGEYARMLTALDDAVGRIVAAVDRRGLRKNTLFIFSSDNGGPAPGKTTDNGPLRAGKGTPYEGGVRVAAFATWDGVIRPGTKVEVPLHIVDWYPTLVKLAGGSLDQPLPLDGRDAWSAITAGAPSPHDAILLNSTPTGGAVRVGDWKLVLNGDKSDEANAGAGKPGKKQSRETVELFNLADDPNERTNVAERNGEKVAELRRRYDALAREAVPPKQAPPPKGFRTPAVWGEHN